MVYAITVPCDRYAALKAAMHLPLTLVRSGSVLVCIHSCLHFAVPCDRDAVGTTAMYLPLTLLGEVQLL